MSRRSEYTDRFRTDIDYRSQRGVSNVSISDTSPPANEISVAQILALIDRATGLWLQQPNYALNLQIADLVKEKKGQAPREVAMKLAKMAYPSYGKRAILALSVLDVCVKNCGYPFHLAISRRDFLNSLVRSFGQQPPLNYSHLQNLILQMLQEWEVGLVKNSKYRDDLINIRDINRLLQHKGYIFPEVSMQDVAALTPMDDSLKSAAELEREDREVQSAKLHELIRSGTPEDLKEANKLMSLMAGFRESRIDYRVKVAAELEKVRRRCEVLAEMLQSGEKPDLESMDVFKELQQSLKSALPKIQNILNDTESMDDDEEAHAKIVRLKANIEIVLRKYDAVMMNDPNANNINISDTAGKSSVVSLIDIDDEHIGNDKEPKTDLFGDGNELRGLTLGKPSLTNTPASKPVPTSDILNLDSVTSPATFTTTKSCNDTEDLFAAFVSTPSESLTSPPTSEFTQIHTDDSLTVSYSIKRLATSTEFEFDFTNAGHKKITNLDAQFAPPKSLTLEIGIISTTSLEPNQHAKQRVTLLGAGAPKLRWKADYNYGLEKKSVKGDLKNI